MASLLSLSAELKLSIIEQLELQSNSFIPAPSLDLLSLSRVCKVFRAITLPYLLKEVVLLNDEKSGSSVSIILDSPYAEHVRSLHFVGVIPFTPDPSLNLDQPPRSPQPEDLPESVQYALSKLAKFPNLECLIVEFRCSRAKEEEEEIYSQTYDIFEELEEPQMTLEIEEADAFRSLTKRTYNAIAQNPPYAIKSLELRNVVAKRCSAWETSAFRALLEGLSVFKISLRGGDNGAGWRINKVAAYLSFVGSLDTIFLRFTINLRHLSISATTDGPPGLAEGMNNVELPLKEDILKNLEVLDLEHVFISKDLAAFIVAHGSSLNTIRLKHCYSGEDENNCAEEASVSWGEFFTIIASAEPNSLRVFDIAPTDLETAELPEEGAYDLHCALPARELLEKIPGRRMFDYKTVDDKYGMLFTSDEAFSLFEDGTDHAGWERLCAMLAQNTGTEV